MTGWQEIVRAVFARHSNPWSMWTRWASTPLVLVPVWRRSGRDAALVGLWMALVAAHRRRALPAAAATAFEMGLLMVYWELMVRYYERHGGAQQPSQP